MMSRLGAAVMVLAWAAVGAAQETKPAVLLVIANQDFFYREYDEPKKALEAAGFRVDVAAPRKGTCRPHANSGQTGGGEVTADLAIADADAKKYETVIFAGGWGASVFHYNFAVRYHEPAYNGEAAMRTATNKLIGEFVKADKYVCGLCHGVSVLAWARVDGKSVLAGKSVSAPGGELPGPAFSAQGKNQQPTSKWHSETNGAKVAAGGSVGRPGTSADDVTVDGKVVTGENDQSAAELGRVVAKLLKK